MKAHLRGRAGCVPDPASAYLVFRRCGTAALVRAGAFLLFMSGAAWADGPAECDHSRAQLLWDGGQAEFRVELAVDAAARRRGLMFRESLPRFSGMLFAYPEPRHASFWMKNTPIPLDILFFDDRGVLTRLHENAEPYSLKSVRGGDGIQFVLEINGGLSARLGIVEGAEIRHPLVPAGDAAPACNGVSVR